MAISLKIFGLKHPALWLLRRTFLHGDVLRTVFVDAQDVARSVYGPRERIMFDSSHTFGTFLIYKS